ncbi:hypothetical protein [Mesorhizobium sp. M0965]|uniref:hypothetical protein n=1 Tax=unclassified Mesorhizobium TaxID=325217 RepID=UPI0033359825
MKAKQARKALQEEPSFWCSTRARKLSAGDLITGSRAYSNLQDDRSCGGYLSTKAGVAGFRKRLRQPRQSDVIGNESVRSD